MYFLQKLAMATTHIGDEMVKGKGQYSLFKTLLGFDFDIQQKNDVAKGGKESKTPHHPT